MSTAIFRDDVVAPSVPPGVTLLPVGDGLWRVLDGSGRALGHLAVRREPAGARYEARRFHVAGGGFRQLGAFWTAAEAVECLRLSR